MFMKALFLFRALSLKAMSLYRYKIVVGYLVILGMLVLTLSLSGCKTISKSTSLTSPPRVVPSPIEEGQFPVLESYNLTVAVVPFTENRLDVNKSTRFYRYLIPLVPYGTAKYERPEEARIFNTVDEFKSNIRENLTKILFGELKRSKIFNNVIYTSKTEGVNADLILGGEVNSTLYEGKTYSYGVSFLGPVLWLVGLPAGSSYNKLNLTLHLKQSNSDELIWSYTFNKEKTVLQGLYYNRGRDNNYINLMQDGMREIIEDLRQKLSEIPQEQLKAKVSEPKPGSEPKSELESKPSPESELTQQEQLLPIQEEKIAPAESPEQ